MVDMAVGFRTKSTSLARLHNGHELLRFMEMSCAGSRSCGIQVVLTSSFKVYHDMSAKTYKLPKIMPFRPFVLE